MPPEAQSESPSGSAASFVDQVPLQAVHRFLNTYLHLLETLVHLHIEQVNPEVFLLVPRKIF